MKKRILSMFTALCLAVGLLVLPVQAAESDVVLSGSPGAVVEYAEDSQVTPGTIRYVNQIITNPYFHLSYWNGYQTEAYQECGTSAISMALSYIGINATPETLANYWGGAGSGSFSTYFYMVPGVSGYYSGDFASAYQRYESGGGQYSPVVIHLTSYSERGHFVVVAGKLSDTVYQIVDPGKATIWEMTMIPDGCGNYDISYVKNGVTITDYVSQKDLGCYQYYNANVTAVVEAESAVPENPFTDVPGDWMEESICRVYDKGLMVGYSSDQFYPSAVATRGALAYALYQAAGAPEVESECGFTDVSEDAYYRDAITWASENRLLCGVGNKCYDPASPVTRQQLLLVLQRYVVNYAGCERKNVADDVDLEEYSDYAGLAQYNQEVLKWAVGNGLIQGSTEMTLEAEAFATRGQMAVILNRLFSL